MDLISVIVPVYKVEQYLDRCVQSIVDQTYTNLEIILVDDGSPDNCGSMCDAWAEKDSRIKVLHKENGGVSAARNSGIDAAAGDFLCFVDSDDWIHESFVDRLYHAITENNASVSVCGIQKLTTADAAVPPVTADVRIYSAEEGMSSLVNGGIFIGTVWDKLYRRDVVGDTRFPVGKRHEDEFFIQNVFVGADQLVFVDSALYYYFQQDNSFMHTMTMEHLDMLDACLERISLVEQYYPSLIKNAKAAFCVLCVVLCRDALKSSAKEVEQYIKRIKARRKSVRFTLQELLSYPLKKTIYNVASGLCLVAFAKLLNFKNGGK